MSPVDPRHEIERIKRVADLLCSAHAGLRDQYADRALLLDICILAASTWLVAISFVDPQLGARLAPFSLTAQIWAGVLGVATFFFTLVQIKTDWKSRSDAHKRSMEMYAEVKLEAGYLLAGETIEVPEYRRVISRNDMAAASAVEVPERAFLAQKRRHKIKVAISKHLDEYPLASVRITKLRWWWRDNIRRIG